MKIAPRLLALLAVASVILSAGAETEYLDLITARVVISKDILPTERKAVEMLIGEVGARTQILWEVAQNAESEKYTIVVAQRSQIKALFPNADLPNLENPPAEGYCIWTEKANNGFRVFVAGNDSRGVTFGVGRLLRSLRMTERSVSLPSDIHITASPEYSIRGHQLGYRPKPNSYDGWTLEIMEQYIRDLIVFGCNAVELIPPRSDDKDTSPHFPLPQMETMTGMSKICDDYGIDVWIWYPALDDDYTDPQTLNSALDEWGGVFETLPRVDAVFVPCGDPGHTPPEILLPMLAKQAARLKELHPNATWWIGPQGFSTERLELFHRLISENPPWLTGICYGPWTRLSLPEFRKFIPERYPIRHYPDITHCIFCQYPVPDWDPAFAFTEGREVVNPRPVDQANIFRQLQPYTNGYICYSEGCNDDVNKIVWSALGWDSKQDVLGILREYGRYFIGADYEDDFALGLLALEKNWRGPVLANPSIETALRQFQDMEKTASPALLLNWRFQQGLFRAYYDAFVRRRLIHETNLENQALTALERATRIGSLLAMKQASDILEEAALHPTTDDLRGRLFELAEGLYQSIRMQFLTERYLAGRDDGAVLDRVDAPLNNGPWLLKEFERIAAIDSEKERLDELNEILNWRNPGSGGYYDNLGDVTQQPHLLGGKGYKDDPAFFETPLTLFARDEEIDIPTSWKTHAIALYDSELKMQYENLDPSARYRLRVVYASGPLRLTADGVEIHTYVKKPYQVLEFDIPQETTRDGKLTLAWNKKPGEGSSGRANQVCEVGLMKSHRTFHE